MSQMNRLIASLCYFSFFFLPFVLPIVVYFIVEDLEVKQHAKSSVLSHILPLVSIPFLIYFAFNYGGWMIVLVFLIFGAIILTVTIWNIYRGVQILLK
jgi:hypothetical protein